MPYDALRCHINGEETFNKLQEFSPFCRSVETKGVMIINKKKLRYAILKEIDSGNKAITEKDFSVTEEEFDDAIGFLKREGYLNGFFYADNRPWLIDGTAYVTEKGEKYLAENGNLAKTYRGLKEIRDWLL